MKSPLDDVEIPRDVGVGQFILKAMTEHGENKAIIESVSGRITTYSDLVRQIRSLVSGLYKLGLKKNDVVLVCLPNCTEFPVVLVAVLYLGGIVCPINPANTVAGIQQQMIDTDPSFIVTAPEHLPKINNALQTCPSFERVKVVYTTGNSPAPGGCTALNDLYEPSQAAPPSVHIDPIHQVALYPYSSGTTGRLKCVKISHYNILANLCQFSHPTLLPTPKTHRCAHDVKLSTVPFFHMYGLNVVLLHCLLQGDTLVMYPKYSLQTVLEAVQTYKVTLLYIVPPIALTLAKSPLVDRYDTSSLRCLFSGAAPLKKDICLQLIKRLNLDDLQQGYGMTECSPGATHPVPHSGKYGSVGVPLPNTEIKVVDPVTRCIVGQDAAGEIWLRGPQVMLGYLRNTAATAEILDNDGWLHTGDIGIYDKDGYFYIVDRLKELIKYKGFQVPPAELEAVVSSHPAVLDVAVIGIPEPSSGEVPCAYVVRRAGTNVAAENIVQFVKDRVVHYMQLRGGVRFVSDIPKNPSGKILRRILRTQAMKEAVEKMKFKL